MKIKSLKITFHSKTVWIYEHVTLAPYEIKI